MPQVCLAEMPGMFQSDDRKQQAMKKIWNLVRDGLCVRPMHTYSVQTDNVYMCIVSSKCQAKSFTSV